MPALNIDEDGFLAEIGERGFAYLRGALLPHAVDALRREIAEALEAADARSAGPRVRQWTPLLGRSSPVAQSIFLESPLSMLAERALARPVFGVMMDANRSGGAADLHSDAEDWELAGLRFNLYVDELAPGEGALTFFPGSHEPARWHHLHEDPARVLSGPAVSEPVSPGDLAAFDLRTWHTVQSSGVQRVFASAFYYAVPRTPAEEAAVARSAARNRDAPRAFGRTGEGLYPPELLQAAPPAWEACLHRYGFTSAA